MHLGEATATTTLSDNFQTYQRRIQMKNSRSKSQLIVSILVIPIFVIILSDIIWADQGVIITLENTGPSPITDAYLGFNLVPLNPGADFEFTVGAGSNPYLSNNIGDFQIGVMPISYDNPLSPGGTACVGPLYQIARGDYVELVAASSFGNGFTENPPDSVFKIKPDVTTHSFDLAHDRAQGGRIAGVFRFLTSVPDSCKTVYALPFGVIEVDAGAALTDSTSVYLSLRCYPTVGYSCKEMQFSNDNINWSAPEPYKMNKTWILSVGDGEKTVYVKFMDNSDNWSNVYSDKLSQVKQLLRLMGVRLFPLAQSITFGGGALLMRKSSI
jgi:hypothetical protein